jgi:hypothetical protein
MGFSRFLEISAGSTSQELVVALPSDRGLRIADERVSGQDLNPHR